MGAGVTGGEAGEATPAAAPSPPSTTTDSSPPPRAPPPSGLLPTKLESAGNDAAPGALVHSPARRLATTTVSPGAGTLQAALDAASAGDILELADGTYTGSAFCQNMLEISKDITIRAQNLGQAVLDGENARGVISITSGTVTLDSLNITKGSDTYGGGVYIVSGTVMLTSCDIYSNTANVCAHLHETARHHQTRHHETTPSPR